MVIDAIYNSCQYKRDANKRLMYMGVINSIVMILFSKLSVAGILFRKERNRRLTSYNLDQEHESKNTEQWWFNA